MSGVLLDTNLLTRLSQPNHPHHSSAERAVYRLKKQNRQLLIVSQNIYEYWAVATRPIESLNGQGLSVVDTLAEIKRIQSLFQLLPDTPAIYHRWLSLVEQYSIKGKQSHDARLVAAMQVHGISELLTFNTADFARYESIQAIDPLHVSA